MRPVVLFDLGKESLSVFRVDRDGGAVLSLETVPLPEGEIFPAEFTTLVESTDECCLNLPVGLLNFRIVDMPFSDLRKVRELLPLQLEGLIFDGVSSVVIDAFVLGGSDGKFRVFAAYISKAVLGDILDRLKRRNLEPRHALSLDLVSAIRKSGNGDIADLLLSPAPLSNTERASLFLQEFAKPTFNFRRDEFSYTIDDAKQKRSLALAGVILCLILVVFLADRTLVMFSLRGENQAIRDGLRKTYQGIFPADKKISDEVYQMKAHLKELREKDSSFTGASPLEAMLDISRIVKPGVTFAEITVDTDLILLKGECPSLGDTQKIKTDLEKLFSDVNVSDIKPSAQNRTQFTVTAKGRRS